MSKLTLTAIGNLGRDCSIRHLENGSVAISFPVASTQKYKDKQGNNVEQTTWIDCTIWKKPETMKIAEYLKKGQQVFIEGKPSTRGYKAKSSDEIHSALLMRVDDLVLLGGRPASASTSTAETPAVTTQTTENIMNDSVAPVTAASAEEDLPF